MKVKNWAKKKAATSQCKTAKLEWPSNARVALVFEGVETGRRPGRIRCLEIDRRQQLAVLTFSVASPSRNPSNSIAGHSS